MTTKERTRLSEKSGVVALSFNKNRTEVAFSPNSHLIFIYNTVAQGEINNSRTWEHLHTLSLHEQTVMGIDWHHESDRLLSCAQDRTAFVWIRQRGVKPDVSETKASTAVSKETWVPQIVVLDATVKRGLLCCAWSFHGQKLYIGSAASNVAVCAFSSDNGWWDCWRVIESHTSSVVSVVPNPMDNTCVASGSLDGTVAISSTLIKAIDGKETGAKKFGTEYCRIALPGRPWVHAVTWNPKGDVLAICSHDSRVYIATKPRIGESEGEEDKGGRKDNSSDAENISNTDNPHVYVITSIVSLKLLPMKCLSFISNSAIVAGGFDNYPIYIEKKGATWTYVGRWVIDGVAPAFNASASSQAALARKQFQTDSRMSHRNALQLAITRHKNFITSLQALTQTFRKNNESSSNPIFATSAMDGTVEFWKYNEISSV